MKNDGGETKRTVHFSQNPATLNVLTDVEACAYFAVLLTMDLQVVNTPFMMLERRFVIFAAILRMAQLMTAL